MSSRYHSKKPSNILNKENEAAPLNMIKKTSQSRRDPLGEKKTQHLSLAQPAEKALKAHKNDTKETVQSLLEKKETEVPKQREGSLTHKEMLKEERKKDSIRFRKIETERVMSAYSKSWISDMKDKEQKFWPTEFLENHKISAGVRAKMVGLFLL